jgi:acyl-CoA synthetase (AMP-forming)/AMP-acid ligase II
MTTSFDVPQPLIPDFIAQHGEWQAAKPALIEGERRLSWGDFDRSTNRVANGLGALGLALGTRLAVLMSNSMEMAEVLFGAGKAGVSVVPLNLSVNDAAVAAMIADSGATAVAASGEQCARIDALVAAGKLPASIKRIGLDTPPESGPAWLELKTWRDAQSTARPRARITPQTECNIIYSSGTTGLPKGIVHSHECRAHWANDMAIALRYHSGAITVCSLGLYSNISWVAVLATVLVGGTIVIMPSFTPANLLEHFARYRVTHGTFVPVQLRRLLELEDLGAHDRSSLQTIMCCGSPLPPPIKRAARDALGCGLIELYGLTEGIITTLAPEDFDRKIESVGKPVPGQQLKIVGDDDRELPRGAAGEVVGYGRMVMEGYHHRPDATREATWTDPEGRRWLRTGDIGRLDEEGFLYIVDRKKDMILSGGQNIFPADIEAVMREHPQVADVAVIGVPSEKWGETPLAVVVPKDGAPPDSLALLEWTNARVGKQQRIAGVAFRESLPRNPNGKILKRELRAQHTRANA